ncbi:variable large family protein [Borrelia crocidurae]|uniref:Variable large protein n=1 Tax=Borrelia crocidurae (strain Achema) TaxID=1155096 RepID=I0FEQ5_BORCA|nr:variable large family protein [Borrelia crocidurae]AFI31961.1 VmpM protein [Borrelia crocidurae str. Achema]
MKEKKELGEIGRREERRKGRILKGIVMVVVMMVMGCNSGGVGESKESVENRFLKSLVGLSNEFLNVFTSFGDMVGSVLGLNVDSKKSDVGKYFKTVQDTVQGVKDKLEKVVADMKREGNPNAVGVESAVKKLVSETLDKIIGGAKIVSEAIGDASDPITNMAVQNAGAVGIGIDSLVKGIKSIVEVVLKGGNAEAGDDNKAETLSARTGGNDTAGEAGKLFNAVNADSDANVKKSAADAAKAVASVTGADILQAMIKANGDAVKLADGTVVAQSAKKDVAIAGAIVLRAMAKNGKFAGPNNNASAEANKTVAGAATSALTKALDTLTISVRSTIDSGLKIIKEAIKIDVNDSFPVIPDKIAPEVKK